MAWFGLAWLVFTTPKPQLPLPFSFPELEDCYEDVALRHRLWTSVRGWAELTQGWLGERFDLLQPGAMEEAIGSYSRAVFKMERGLVPNKVGEVGGCR